MRRRITVLSVFGDPQNPNFDAVKALRDGVDAMEDGVGMLRVVAHGQVCGSCDGIIYALATVFCECLSRLSNPFLVFACARPR